MTREQLDAIRKNVDFNDVSIHDVIPLLAEVERLTADPLPAAAWVREVERAAFSRGVAAMREAAAQAFRPDPFDYITSRIRSLPDPEDKS